MAAGVGVALNPIVEDKVHFPGYFENRVDLQSSESILIYLSVAGSVIPIRVLESDSIASVKLRIQTCKGFVVKKQKLVYGGRELARKDTLVKDYGVSGGDVLHLVLKLSDLLAITVSTACGKEFEFQVDRYRNVGYLKQRIFKEGQGFVALEDQQLFCQGEKLEDQRLINDISKNNDGVIHLLVKKSAKVRATPIEKDVELSVVASDIRPRDEIDECEKQSNELCVVSRNQPERDFWLQPIIVNPKIRLSPALLDMINSAFDGLDKGNLPIRSTEGTGGAYFMFDPSGQKIVAVFKPTDEEPKAVNNPQGLPLSENGEGLKIGTKVGEGALREVAAYLLDHPKTGPRASCGGGDVIGFSGVPPTAMVECLHKGFNHPEGYEGTLKNVKIGSLQMFRENDGNCEDIGPHAFPVDEVHKISVLDLRLANADRHAGNILFKRNGGDGRIELIPIDHGYCLPDSFEDCTFDWLYWPQASKPFSSETINYIKSLDSEKDLELLKFHGWEIPVEAARTLRISTMLLKKGAEKGLTPFTIGNIMCREILDKKSMIEEIISEAQQSLLPEMSEEDFLKAVSQIMDFELAKLS